jgi:hypothetical protein
VKEDQDGRIVVTVSSTRTVSGRACSEDFYSDESDSKVERSSTTKRSSKSCNSKESIDQYVTSRSNTSDDATTSMPCQSWLHRMMCLLLLILLALCGTTCSFMIFNDVSDGYFDSAASGSVNNVFPR